jgi:hypothetical protein
MLIENFSWQIQDSLPLATSIFSTPTSDRPVLQCLLEGFRWTLGTWTQNSHLLWPLLYLTHIQCGICQEPLLYIHTYSVESVRNHCSTYTHRVWPLLYIHTNSVESVKNHCSTYTHTVWNLSGTTALHTHIQCDHCSTYTDSVESVRNHCSTYTH